MTKIKWRWFEWGNEKPGYVSTWRLGEKGAVVRGPEIKYMTAISRGYIFDCPYN